MQETSGQILLTCCKWREEFDRLAEIRLFKFTYAKSNPICQNAISILVAVVKIC